MSKKPCTKLCFRKRSGHKVISNVFGAKLVLLKVGIISKVSVISKLVYHLKISIISKVSITSKLVFHLKISIISKLVLNLKPIIKKVSIKKGTIIKS